MFEVHKLNEQGLVKAELIRREFEIMVKSLETLCGSAGREMAIVRTKLEEACFFAKRAMALDERNQVEEKIA